MSSKNINKTAFEERPYKFTINEIGKLTFATKGAKILKAVLTVNNTTLSILKPEYDNKWTSEIINELKFFGPGKFLHTSLLREPNSTSDINVTLICAGDNESFPSLVIGECSNKVTWKDFPSGEFIENVTVGSNSGEKNLKLGYFRTEIGGLCGFVA
jgi:hypothetical protein